MSDDVFINLTFAAFTCLLIAPSKKNIFLIQIGRRPTHDFSQAPYNTAADTKQEPYLSSYLNRQCNINFVHMPRIVPMGL